MSRFTFYIAGVLLSLAAASLPIRVAVADRVFSRSDLGANVVIDWGSVFGVPPGTELGCACAGTVDGVSFTVNSSSGGLSIQREGMAPFTGDFAPGDALLV